MGFFEKLQAKLELYRLEQRYTRRDKRTTFISEAQYVDGEYVYGPASPKSSGSGGSGGSGSSKWGVGGARVGIREIVGGRR